MADPTESLDRVVSWFADKVSIDPEGRTGASPGLAFLLTVLIRLPIGAGLVWGGLSMIRWWLRGGAGRIDDEEASALFMVGGLVLLIAGVCFPLYGLKGELFGQEFELRFRS